MSPNVWPKVLLAVIVLAILAGIMSRRPHQVFQQGPSPPGPESVVTAMPAASEQLASRSTNSELAPATVLASLSDGINRFITNTHPFGLDTPILPEEIKWIRTNNNGWSLLVETKSHLYEVSGSNVTFFLSNFDGIDTRRDPTARGRWYQAIAPWTQEEAVKETYAIMERLGITSVIGRIEYEATPIHVSTPTGETVEVAPFHTVWLHGTNDIGALEAQYRVSSSGPGRLVRFFTTMR